MKKLLIIIAITSTLVGCGVGDTMQYRTRGHVFLKGEDTVCLKSLPNDILNSYLLTSSEDHYKTTLLVENYINLPYPNTCMKINLKKNFSYNIIYIMNNQKFRVDFTLGDYNDLIEEK